MKKKYFLVSVVIFLSVALAATATISADGYTSEWIDGYTWFYRIDGSTVEIGSRGLGSAAISPQPIGHLNIPSALGGKAVTSIGDWAFYNCSNLTSVTIPVGVTSIGLYAFRNCRGLTSMTIPTGNISIGQYAFYGCRGLASVTIGNGVTSIKDDAFDGCSGLTAFSVGSGNQTYKSVSGLLLTKDGKTLIHGVNGAVTIPDGVTSIGRNAFSNCIGLTHVVIPNSVTSIGRNAFYNCRETLFDTATIPGVKLVDGWVVGHTSSLSGQLDLTGARGIGSYAFSSGCSGLTSVTIPDSVTSIGESAFSGCNENLFDTTTIPGVMLVDGWAVDYTSSLSGQLDLTGVRNIGRYAFSDCSGLTSVTIPDSVTSIGEYAFLSCTGLTSVAISHSVKSIRQYAFAGCYNLESFNVDNRNTKYSSTNGCLLSKDGTQLIAGVAGNVIIPDSVTSIEDQAFYNMGHSEIIDPYYGIVNKFGLISVTMPCTITNIGCQAFYNCIELGEVTMPDGVTDIGNQAFYNCSGLRNVTISDSVSKIGSQAFYNCNSLTNLTIPAGVAHIGDEAFSRCRALASIIIMGDDLQIGMSAFSPCLGVERVYLPTEYVGSTGEFPSGADIIRYKSIQTVYLNAAGGQVSPPSMEVRWMSAYGPLPVPSRDGYYFVEWTYKGNPILDDSIVSAFDDHTLVARWCPFQCSITFNANGGSGGKTVTQDYGTRLYAPTVEREGYTFTRWLPTVPATVPASNATYTAQWQINQYTIRFNANGGTGSRMMTRDYGTSMSAPTVEREGYTFAGWSPAVPATVPAYNATYTAQWQANQYEMTFNANGGTGGDTIILDYGASLSGPTVTREGYTFTGWLPVVPATVPASNATYTAQWRINQYDVTFDANGGAGGGTATQNYGTALVAPTVVREGYTFTGWSPTVPMTMPADNATYTAQWQINQYNVTFDANGGAGGGTVIQDYGTSLLAPTVTREGYTFTGWMPTVPTTMPADNVTYTAQWQINQYDMTFDANGGTGGGTVTQNYGTALVAPMVVREGYTFTGWTPAVPSAVPAGNATYTAQWRINQYDATFDANGGTGGGTVTQNYGTALVAPMVARDGYTFTGWAPAVPATVPAGNATYTAQWRINQYRVTFNARGGDGGWTQEMDYGSPIVVPTPTRINYIFEGWVPTPEAIVPDHDVTYVAQWRSTLNIIVSSANSKIKDLYPNDYQRITNIVIEASVASLPDNFFEGCDALENVTFLSPGTELGNNDLRNVGRLFANQPDGYWIVQGVLLGYKGVCPREIPGLDSVKRVMGDAIEGCAALEELSFTAESVLTTIGTNAFKHCTELRQMTLPPSLIEIGNEAFMGCSYLGNVIVPGSVEKVGDRAFKNCTGFTAAQIEYGVESLGEEAFCGDWQIKEVDIPSTVTNIGVNAFGGDSSIIRIGLRGDVRKASEIFSNYKFIRDATVKEGTGEVVDGLFSGFEKLRDVRFFGNCPQLENEGQLLYAMTPGKSDDNAGLTTYVEANSTGWDGTPGSHSLPQAWPLVGGSRRAIAYWDVPSYLCQFESNGGTLGVQDTYQYSEKPFMLPPEPVQSGYKFAGWWTKPVGGLHVTSDTIFIEGVYTMLYAHWIKGHWVFLDPNGGTVVNDYITYVEETTYGVLPSPVRSGYAFNGWLYNDIVIEPTTVISDKNDHTLVAQWTANLYSVRYHANGGVGNMADESRTYGVEQALRKNIFVNDGYVFAGWATNETDEIIYSDCEVVSNMTAIANGWIDLYAVWEESDITPDPSNLNFYFSGDANWERCAEGVEVERDGETVRFDSVWKSGFVTNNQASVLAADVYGAGKIGFWWKVSCESFRNWKLDNLEFAIDGVPQEPWINGETDWQYLEFEVHETGAHTLTWTYSKDESDDGMDVGEDCGRITAAVWTPSLVTLGDYVNCPRLEFRSSGDAEWAGDLQVSHDGIASLRSGEISHNTTTKVELDVDGEGRIGFWWKVSSEAFRQLPIDYVSFKIDGIEQAWIGGEVDWTNVAFNVVGNGTHTLSWEYHKDSEGSAGEDRAWLDEVVWMPSGGTIPGLSPAQAAAWVSNDLAPRYAKGGESAADYKSRFEAKFGADPVAALSKTTGKKDAQGNDMYVWQDYVAGTDPTDTNSVFTATITMVDGAPVVGWSPKLSAAEEAQRRYTIYGKASLESGEEWHSPTNALDRFFMVGVEMR